MAEAAAIPPVKWVDKVPGLRWYLDAWKALYHYTKLGVLQGGEWAKIAARYLHQNWINMNNLQQATKFALTVYGYYLVIKWSWKVLSGLATLYSGWKKNKQVNGRTYESIYGTREACSKEWVVVTGGTDGIGLEMARELHSVGFNLILVSRGTAPQKHIGIISYDDHENVIVPKVVALNLDFAMSSVDDIYRAIRATLEANGIQEVRLLINNCGGFVQKPFVEQSAEEVIQSLNLNLKSHLATSTYFENKIRPQIPGQASGMIFTSCLLNQRPTPGMGATGYSKMQAEMIIRNISSKYDFCYSGLIVAPGNVLTSANNPIATRTGVPAHTYHKHTAWEAGSTYISAQDCAKMTLKFFARSEARFEKVHGTFKHDLLGLLSGLYLRSVSRTLRNEVSTKRQTTKSQLGLLRAVQTYKPPVVVQDTDYEFV